MLASSWESTPTSSAPPRLQAHAPGPIRIRAQNVQMGGRYTADQGRRLPALMLQGKSRQAERAIRQDFAASLRDHGLTEKRASPKKTRSVAELLEEVERARAKRIEREERGRQRRAEELRRQRERYLASWPRTSAGTGSRPMSRQHGESLGAGQGAGPACRFIGGIFSRTKTRGICREIALFRATHARRKALMKRLDRPA